jgi:hypothetical protein
MSIVTVLDRTVLLKGRGFKTLLAGDGVNGRLRDLLGSAQGLLLFESVHYFVQSFW